MRKNYILVIYAVSLVSILAAGSSWAASYPDLSARALKAKLDSGREVMVINPLSDLEFNNQHIPGSVNIPLHLISSSDKLPADKAMPIITYCLGPK